MKKLLSVIVAVLCLIATPVTAQEDFRIANVSNAVVYGGVYVGPYTGQLGTMYFDAFCVDYLNHIRVGQYHSANITSFTGDITANTRWGQYYGTDAIYGYRAAAYLASQFSVTPYGYRNVEWGTLHSAMWNIFTPNAPNWNLPTEGLIADALVAQDTMDLSDWVIITDTSVEDGLGGKQEFIARMPVSTVPEPATMFLLASGLIGVGVMKRKKIIGG